MMISTSVETLIEQARQLTTPDKLLLVDRILEELDPIEAGLIDEESLAEYQRRADEMRSGAEPGIPWEEALEGVRRELHEDRHSSSRPEGSVPGGKVV
ncbi:MAG TPA: addiction module protein [Planctomycetaceae bacterium]|nr:addiction module protein [Planctomycetaceae bacterium]